MEEVLKFENVTKKYGKVLALNNLSLSIPKGSIYGILGPNGSGKTTALGIALGVIRQNEGGYSWFGQPSSDKARKQIGALLETPNFYPYLSAEQNLKVAAAIKEVDDNDIDRVLDIVNLSSRKKSKFSGFSLGMKQRLAIASVLLGDPQVIVLDEPANGLDPQGIAEVRELIIKLGSKGHTIIVASHIIEEVEKVCTHVVVIKQGNKLAEGEIGEVLREEDFMVLDATDQDKLLSFLESNKQTRNIIKERGKLKVSFSNEISAGEINRLLFQQGIVLTHLEMKKKNLETRFFELTGK